VKDLTQGPISRQLVAMAVPIAIGMLWKSGTFGTLRRTERASVGSLV
jgi:hypothetical protein